MMANVFRHFLAVEEVTACAVCSPTLLSSASNFCYDRYFHQIDPTLVLCRTNTLIISCSNRNVRMTDLKLDIFRLTPIEIFIFKQVPYREF